MSGTSAVVREKALKLGEEAPLVGITSEPPKGIETVADPAIVLLNSGLLHRVGAARMHVRVARRLAHMGYRVLRFDFSGIGDSEARRDGLTFEDSASREVVSAMDYLQDTKGSSKFVLMGLCSGADIGFMTAQNDTRVEGLIQLDPFVYRTPGYYLRHYLRQARDPGAWKTFLSQRAKRIWPGRRDSSGEEEAELEVSPYLREFPPRSQVAKSLESLVSRGVRLLHLFSGGQAWAYNYRRQYQDTFKDVDFRGLLEIEYRPDADHIFSQLAAQDFVVDTTAAWIRRHFPASAEQPSARASRAG